MKYTLTLSPDYVAHWGLWEAVRELLQNAIDLRNENPKYVVMFDYNTGTETLTVGNFDGPELRPETLLLGNTTKRLDDKAVGQFGEGYKLALLVLCRLGYDVKLITGNKCWAPFLEYNEEFKASLLSIQVNDCIREDKGTKYVIKNVSLANYQAISERYLPHANPNSILEGRKGDVFVEGLFVCHHDKLEHGYNFAASQITLDRDRRMIADFELGYETSRIWSGNGRSAGSLYGLLRRGSLDTSYASVSTTQAQDILALFRKEHGNAIPVSSNADVAGVKGAKFAIVPEALKKILWAVGGFILKRIGSPKQRLQAWLGVNGDRLTEESRSELVGILEDMQ